MKLIIVMRTKLINKFKKKIRRVSVGGETDKKNSMSHQNIGREYCRQGVIYAKQLVMSGKYRWSNCYTSMFKLGASVF